MKYGENIQLSKSLDIRCPWGGCIKYPIIDMCIVGGIGRNHWSPATGIGWQCLHHGLENALRLKASLLSDLLFIVDCKCILIIFPNFQPPLLNPVKVFQLGIQKSCGNLGRQKGGSDIDPMVMVHFLSRKGSTVGPLFPDNLRSFGKLQVVNNQHASFPTLNILGLVKRKCSQMSNASQR